MSHNCSNLTAFPIAAPWGTSYAVGQIGFILTRSSANTALVAIAAAYLIWNVSRGSIVDKNGNKIPRGPRGWPVLGQYIPCTSVRFEHFINVRYAEGSFLSLSHYPELTLDFWAKQYGKLYSLWLGNQLFIIVSSPAVARDLMVVNGHVFSSRKEMFIKSKTVFVGRGITATPYNDRWRQHRRIAFGWLSQRAVDTYTPLFDFEATEMIKALYKESKGGAVPINPQPHAGRCSLNNMTTIVFGQRTDSIRHPLVKRALQLSREFMNCTGPMSNLIDFLPILQHIPSPMLIRGKRLHRGLVDTYGGMIEDIAQKLKKGSNVKDCLAKAMIQSCKDEKLDDLDMTILASAFMIGGVETTAAIMQWFSALIPAYPEIQAKAQAELDSVVGRSRLPSVEDEKNLPYCRAIIKEVERCHNPFWLGTPHVASEDFAYKGQYIPKGTVVVLNTWTMHHDESRYSDPMTFNPERYLQDRLTSAESANLADPYQRDHWMFGAGRRICPGMIVAEREIWLTISRMLWAFDMHQLPGEPIDLKEYDGLSGRSPVPFKVLLKPRDEQVAKVLNMDGAYNSID